MHLGIEFSQLRYFAPISVILLILWITINAFNCLMQWFPLSIKNPLSVINFVIFWLWFLIIFYNYFRAIIIGPGFVPKEWRPEIKQNEKYLQFCQICQGFKAPRAHHCRKCNRCIMKLDHHCFWLNTCIGHFNQANFCWFLFYAIMGSIHALLMICPCIYRVLFLPYAQFRNEPIIRFTWNSLISCIVSMGLSIGVILAVGILLIIQLRNIIRNQTTIENRIVSKAYNHNHRRRKAFIYP